MPLFKQPDREALIAFEQISKLPRWAAADKWLSAEIEATLDRLLGSKDTAEIHDLRGRAKGLKEFQQAVRDAGQTLAKTGQTAPLA